MTLSEKLLIPLLDTELTLDDISTQAGFVDIFNVDLNNPDETGSVYLVYLMSICSKQSHKTKNKLKDMKNLSWWHRASIQNMFFRVYKFPLYNFSLKTISEGINALTDDDKRRINSFWKNTDDEVTDFLLGIKNETDIDVRVNSLPEEDSDKHVVLYNIKGECSL